MAPIIASMGKSNRSYYDPDYQDGGAGLWSWR
jgi:hypothetical protein